MQKKSNKTIKAICVLLVLTIFGIIFEEKLIILEKIISSSPRKFAISAISIIVIGTLTLFYIVTKKEKQLITKMMSEIPPKHGIIIDILIYRSANKDIHFEFYPIVKDIENDKIYVSFRKYNYGIYRTYD